MLRRGEVEEVRNILDVILLDLLYTHRVAKRLIVWYFIATGFFVFVLGGVHAGIFLQWLFAYLLSG